ncbi:MAG: hypothetical protein IPJ97_08660 [Proteobacteria bacterium]|nr:hypothetical protein [Pseudomonadota bacterium]
MLLGVACGFAIGNFVINIAPQAISGLMASHGFSAARAGATNSIEIGAIAATCMLLSPVLHRFDHRRSIAFGSALLIVCNLVTAVASGPALIAGIRGVAGVGTGVVLAAASSALVMATDPDRLYAQAALLISLVMTGVIYFIAGVKQSFGHAGLMLAFSGVVLVCTLPAIRLIPRANPVKEQTLRAFREVLLGAGALSVIAMLVFSVLEGSIWNFAERAAMNVGLDDRQVGLLLSVSMFSGLIGAVVSVLAGHALGREWPIIVGSALIGLCGLFIYNPPSTALLVGSLAIFNLGYFLVIPFIFGGSSELDASGRLSATVAGVQVLGGAIGPGFAGAVIERYSYAVLGYTCLALAALTAIAGTGMALAIRRSGEGLPPVTGPVA